MEDFDRMKAIAGLSTGISMGFQANGAELVSVESCNRALGPVQVTLEAAHKLGMPFEEWGQRLVQQFYSLREEGVYGDNPLAVTGYANPSVTIEDGRVTYECYYRNN